ncbi:DUF5818 domain-containing protein [Bauldia sp.]|uniref:DUF5818 domain-containing protein n=1 Tax=Bauldia sp. TaxID=2575872 RepID=UPI003BAAF015
MRPPLIAVTITLSALITAFAAPAVADETVLDKARDALRQAGEHIEDAARDAGRDVSDYLADSPDLNRDLVDFGQRIGLPGFDAARPSPGALLTVKPTTAAPGTEVALTANGLPGNATVTLAAGLAYNDTIVFDTAKTTARGGLSVAIPVPDNIAPGSSLVFAVETTDHRLRLVSAPVTVVAAVDLVTITGTLSNEGATCPALRGDDGLLYTLVGEDLGEIIPGDRVTVTGVITEVSICMQGTTVAVTAIEPAA